MGFVIESEMVLDLFRFGGFVAFVACEVRMDWVKRDVGFVSLRGMVFGFGLVSEVCRCICGA